MMRFDLDHIALNVRDMDSMLRFYIAVLGLKPERLDLYRKRKAPFPSVRVNADTIIDLFPAEMWQGKLGTRSRKPKSGQPAQPCLPGDPEGAMGFLPEADQEMRRPPAGRPRPAMGRAWHGHFGLLP